MAIILNDNIENRSPKSLDNRYLNGGVFPYNSISEVTTTIPESYRFIGLTVNILGVEYWFKDGVTNADLVVKSSFDNSAFTGYTATTETRLQNIEGNVSDLTTNFNSYTGVTDSVLNNIQSDISFLSGATDGKQDKLTAGGGINSSSLSANKIQLDLSNYTSSKTIQITITGATHDFVFHDNSVVKRGIEYGGNYHNTYSLRSLVDKEYVDNLISGLDAKNSVKYATNESDTGITTVDAQTLSLASGMINNAFALVDGDRVLVKNQSNPAENGIYTYILSATTLVRTSDFNSVGEMNNGSFTTVISGSNANTAWIMISPNVEDIGIDPVEWSLFAMPVSGIAAIENIGSGVGIYSGTTDNIAYLKSLVAGSGITITTNNDTIIINASGGTTLGPARDGSYDDGLFPFTPSMPTGFAIDDINQFLGLLAPAQPPALDQQSTSGVFVNGKLSFGPSRNDISYQNVTIAAGNSAIDINGLYTEATTRKGLTQSDVSGVLNDTTVGDISGIPYLNDSFKDGNIGRLVLELNGNIIDTLNLEGTTGATASTRMSVSEATPVKFTNGNSFVTFRYRTGIFNIPTSEFSNGFNYVRVLHTGSTIGSRVTNYTEWVYDPASTPISISGDSLTNLNMSGSKYISGVQYHTAGSVDYVGTLSNVYKNVYSNNGNAVSFPTKVNLSNPSSISLTGTGIIAGSSTALPNLNTAVTNPQDTLVDVNVTLPINVSKVLGNVGNTGKISTNINVLHPFTTKSLTSAASSITGFLMYNINQSDNKESENFTGEVNRLQARDYSSLAIGDINLGAYTWNEEMDLITGDSLHNTGLLVFDGNLLYPNTSYLSTQYGITLGDFSSVSNGPSGNPDYSSASGVRDYYRLFKSNNTTTQSTLTFTISHTGTDDHFLTDGGTGGVPSGDEIKFEFLIKRAGGSTHGWANPFAPTGNPEGIANISKSHAGGTTTVTCTLSTTPRVGSTDVVIVRLFVGSDYENRISNISINNI